MANAFQAYMQAKGQAMQQGANAMAMGQVAEKIQRDKHLRSILAGAYTAPTPEIAMEGPTPTGEALAPIPSQPGGMDMPGAMEQMYAQGLGPEAMQMQAGMTKARGATPSSYREWELLKEEFPEMKKDFPTYLSVQRGQQTVDIGGVPHAFVPGKGFVPLSTAEEETLAKTEQKRAEKLGTVAAKISGEAADQVGKIRNNITNLREVIRLVGEGAETGPLAAQLPSFRQASIELDNMQKQLGLDVIGAVTFGALSKGELDLALSKALPTHLQGPALVQWTKRKIAAQEKLSNYYEDQSIYLTKTGSSQAGWLELQKKKRGGAGPKKGTVKGGYVFMGGNPADSKSWKKQ